MRGILVRHFVAEALEGPGKLFVSLLARGRMAARSVTAAAISLVLGIKLKLVQRFDDVIFLLWRRVETSTHTDIGRIVIAFKFSS